MKAMSEIQIRHWVFWAGIAQKAVRVAEMIKDEFGIEAEVVKGGAGELSVSVNGVKVAKKGWFTSPSEQQMLDAVREALKWKRDSHRQQFTF